MTDTITTQIGMFPILGDVERARVLRDYIAPLQTYEGWPIRLVWTEDADFIGPHLICVKGGRINMDSYRGKKSVRRAPYLRQNGRWLNWDRDAVSYDRQENRIITVGGKASGEFFHWMIEMMPRLTMLRETGALDDATLVMRPAPKRFQIATFDALGLTPRFVESDIIQAKTGGFPTHIINFRGTGAISPEVLDWARIFRDRYLDAAPKQTGRRLYISRADAPKRCMRNEAELAAFLAARGFETCLLSTVSLADQARMFAEAEAIVGLHGAGLSSLIFCRPGTKVIELYPDQFVAVSPFWNLSSMGGLAYRMVLCAEDSASTNHHNGDVTVNFDVLTSALADLGIA